jgi:hypothetical protein
MSEIESMHLSSIFEDMLAASEKRQTSPRILAQAAVRSGSFTTGWQHVVRSKPGAGHRAAPLQIISEIPKFCLTARANQQYCDWVPPPLEGRFAIVTDVGGGMRWTQAVLKTRAPACGRRSRVVLTPRRWCQVRERQLSRATVARKPGSPGRARYKP